MTITSENTRVETSGTGSLTAFPFSWRILNAADITVIVVDASDVETLQVLTTDYTVAGVGGAAGTVNFLNAPAGTETVVVYNDPPITQLVDYSANGPFPAAAHEGALDSNILVSRRTRDIAERSLQFSDGGLAGASVFDGRDSKIKDVKDPTADQDVATQIWVKAEVASAVFDPAVIVTSAGAALIDDATADDQLTTLGGGTIGKAIFKDVTQDNVIQELGFTTFTGSLRFHSTQAIFRGAISVTEDIGIHQSSIIPNADFQVWQNGTSFTNPLTDTYVADQFIILMENANAVNVSKTTSYSPGTRGALRVTQNTNNEKWALLHILDNQRTEPMQSQKVSLSIKAEIGSSDALTEMKMFLLSWSGTADVPVYTGTNLISAWNGATVAPSLASNWAYIGAGAVVSMTSTYQTFVFENQTVPADCTNLAIMFITNDSSFSSTDVVNTTNWNLVHGEKSKLFASRSREQELLDCSRFFASTFPYEVAPVTNVGNTIGTLMAKGYFNDNIQVASIEWRYPVEMISDPNVLTYNPGAANVNWRNLADMLDETRAIEDKDKVRVFISCSTAIGVGESILIHATADARF